MRSAELHVSQPPSPWLSLWFKPGDTIERIVATNPRRHVLLLATASSMSNIVFGLIDSGGLTTEILNWRILAGIVLIGAVFGLVYLYVYGLLLWISGRMFGGRATWPAVRAAFAWGMAPTILALAAILVALIGFKLLAGEAPRSTLQIMAGVIAGVLGVWALLAIFLMLKRVQGFGFWRAAVSSILGVILISLVPLLIRSFLFQPFTLPSGSTKPTLLVGDYVFASKFSYGYTRYSLPFSPPLSLLSARIFASEPERGDVVVFRLPKDDATAYIKRIVGLPGDRIQMIKGQLYINGVPVAREQIEDFIETENGRTTRVKRWRETLPNGVSYETLDLVENGFYDNTKVYEVPPGHYFMMGDNRDNSTDSRVESAVGTVPLENLVGRVQIIFFSIDQDSAERRVRLERIGMRVR